MLTYSKSEPRGIEYRDDESADAGRDALAEGGTPSLAAAMRATVGVEYAVRDVLAVGCGHKEKHTDHLRETSNRCATGRLTERRTLDERRIDDRRQRCEEVVESA
jgi:hypothetical protein